MTLAAIQTESRPRDRARVAERSLLDRPGVVILLGIVLSFVLSWPRAVVIWRDNTFFDTDDAMRLVQVRAWLAGQGWFDLVAHRLFPPAGLLMHWSRIVDLPMGGLIRLFETFADVDTSERLARIVFPLLLQAGLLTATVTLGTLLAGRRALMPTMILTVLSGFTFEQFPAGRIDHHAPQITLLVAMSAAVLSALSARRAWHAGLAALCLAVSLAISLENLPFIAVIVAILPLAWVVDPAGTRRALLWFAGGLAVFVPALFLATIPPTRYASGVCDAFSIAHLIGVCAGAVGFGLLAAAAGHLRSIPARAAALVAVGAAVGACVLATYPACLRDPYAGMDPVLKDLWLSHVTEAQPFFVAARERPDTATILGGPLVAGLLGLIAAVVFERGIVRARWLAVLALTLMGIAGTLWEIRVAASTQPLALLGGVWVVTRLLEAARNRPLATTGAAACVLPFATLAWAVVPTGQGSLAAADAMQRGQVCRSAVALAPLATLPPGLVFAPIDDGSHLLVATPHSVVAAPYHRNRIGNRLVLDGFLATPEAAETIVRGSRARYLALCPGETEVALLAGLSPASLAARLTQGDVPGWLTPVPVGDSPYRVFAVKP